MTAPSRAAQKAELQAKLAEMKEEMARLQQELDTLEAEEAAESKKRPKRGAAKGSAAVTRAAAAQATRSRSIFFQVPVDINSIIMAYTGTEGVCKLFATFDKTLQRQLLLPGAIPALCLADNLKGFGVYFAKHMARTTEMVVGSDEKDSFVSAALSEPILHVACERLVFRTPLAEAPIAEEHKIKAGTIFFPHVEHYWPNLKHLIISHPFPSLMNSNQHQMRSIMDVFIQSLPRNLETLELRSAEQSLNSSTAWIYLPRTLRRLVLLSSSYKNSFMKTSTPVGETSVLKAYLPLLEHLVVSLNGCFRAKTESKGWYYHSTARRVFSPTSEELTRFPLGDLTVSDHVAALPSSLTYLSLENADGRMLPTQPLPNLQTLIIRRSVSFTFENIANDPQQIRGTADAAWYDFFLLLRKKSPQLTTMEFHVTLPHNQQRFFDVLPRSLTSLSCPTSFINVALSTYAAKHLPDLVSLQSIDAAQNGAGLIPELPPALTKLELPGALRWGEPTLGLPAGIKHIKAWIPSMEKLRILRSRFPNCHVGAYNSIELDQRLFRNNETVMNGYTLADSIRQVYGDDMDDIAISIPLRRTDYLPPSLTSVSYRDGCSIDPVTLKMPYSSTALNGFKLPLASFPASITFIDFSSLTIRPLSLINLPPALTHLRHDGKISDSHLEGNDLPPSLTKLEVPLWLFNAKHRFPSALTELSCSFSAFDDLDLQTMLRSFEQPLKLHLNGEYQLTGALVQDGTTHVDIALLVLQSQDVLAQLTCEINQIRWFIKASTLIALPASVTSVNLVLSDYQAQLGGKPSMCSVSEPHMLLFPSTVMEVEGMLRDMNHLYGSAAGGIAMLRNPNAPPQQAHKYVLRAPSFSFTSYYYREDLPDRVTHLELHVTGAVKDEQLAERRVPDSFLTTPHLHTLIAPRFGVCTQYMVQARSGLRHLECDEIADANNTAGVQNFVKNFPNLTHLSIRSPVKMTSSGLSENSKKATWDVLISAFWQSIRRPNLFVSLNLRPDTAAHWLLQTGGFFPSTLTELSLFPPPDDADGVARHNPAHDIQLPAENISFQDFELPRKLKTVFLDSKEAHPRFAQSLSTVGWFSRLNALTELRLHFPFTMPNDWKVVWPSSILVLDFPNATSASPVLIQTWPPKVNNVSLDKLDLAIDSSRHLPNTLLRLRILVPWTSEQLGAVKLKDKAKPMLLKALRKK